MVKSLDKKCTTKGCKKIGNIITGKHWSRHCKGNHKSGAPDTYEIVKPPLEDAKEEVKEKMRDADIVQAPISPRKRFAPEWDVSQSIACPVPSYSWNKTNDFRIPPKIQISHKTLPQENEVDPKTKQGRHTYTSCPMCLKCKRHDKLDKHLKACKGNIEMTAQDAATRKIKQLTMALTSIYRELLRCRGELANRNVELAEANAALDKTRLLIVAQHGGHLSEAVNIQAEPIPEEDPLRMSDNDEHKERLPDKESDTPPPERQMRFVEQKTEPPAQYIRPGDLNDEESLGNATEILYGSQEIEETDFFRDELMGDIPDISGVLYGILARRPVRKYVGPTKYLEDECRSQKMDDECKLSRFPGSHLDEDCCLSDPDTEVDPMHETELEKIVNAEAPKCYELIKNAWSLPKVEQKIIKEAFNFHIEVKDSPVVEVELPNVFDKSVIRTAREYLDSNPGTRLRGLFELSPSYAEAIAVVGENKIVRMLAQSYNPDKLDKEIKNLIMKSPEKVAKEIKKAGTTFTRRREEYKETGNLFSLLEALSHKVKLLTFRHFEYVQSAWVIRKELRRMNKQFVGSLYDACTKVGSRNMKE